MVTDDPSAATKDLQGGAQPPPPPSIRADLAAGLQEVCEEALGATGSDTALVLVEDGPEVVCIAAAGRGSSLVGWRLAKDRSATRVCFESKRPLVIADALQDQRADAELVWNLGARSVAAAPVLVRSVVAAVLEVQSAREAAYGPATEDALVGFAREATSVFRKTIRQIAAPARQRPSELPGADDYRDRLATIRSESEVASLLVIVVGPPASETKLQTVHDVLMSQRASDFPFVVDSDAFAVIMPEAPRSAAKTAARRIRGLLNDKGLDAVGFGIAEIGEDASVSHISALTEASADLQRPAPPAGP